MIKVSVLYPNGPEARFDMTYYLEQHMPMVKQKLGADLKGMAVDEGLAAGERGMPPDFVAIGHLLFDSVADFGRSFQPHAAAITGDIPNFTNTKPIVLVSEIKL
jgi:uncharacterized protein (TIGR02118 family)